LADFGGPPQSATLAELKGKADANIALRRGHACEALALVTPRKRDIVPIDATMSFRGPGKLLGIAQSGARF
jgi:hypothetical protein